MKKSFFSILLSLSLCLHFSAQGQNKKTLLQDFDTSFGKSNLKINNGTLHTNKFRTINDKIRYFTKDYVSGTLYYKGEVFYEVPLKFDEFKQQLVLKLQNSTTDFGVNLITKEIDSFAFNNTKFINLQKTQPGFAKENNLSFVEKKAYTNKLNVYVYHSKGKRDKIKGTSVYYEFAEQKSYFAKKGQEFYSLDSRSDFYPLFPSKKEAIKDYYRTYKSLRKSNEDRFIKNLLEYLSK